jgi:predicted nucleotidyltransferase
VISGDPNVAKVELIARALGVLRERLVLVGGCATGLLFTDPAAMPARVTYDVDLLAEVAALSGYHQLEREFAALGFKRDISADAPICRWRHGELEVDLMPTESSILGFSNPWYPIAMATAQPLTLPSGTMIKLISAPALMATKFVAFADRGNNDYLASHDLEDIINLLDGRPELHDEIAQSPTALREYLVEQSQQLIDTAAFHDGLQGFFAHSDMQGAQVARVVERLTKIANSMRRLTID